MRMIWWCLEQVLGRDLCGGDGPPAERSPGHPRRRPLSGDVSGVPDWHGARAAVRAAGADLQRRARGRARCARRVEELLARGWVRTSGLYIAFDLSVDTVMMYLRARYDHTP